MNEPESNREPAQRNGSHPLVIILLFAGIITGLVMLGNHMSKKSHSQPADQAPLGELVEKIMPGH